MQSWAYISAGIIMGSSVVYVALEKLYPYDPGHKLFRRGFALDFVWYSLIQSYLLGLLIGLVIESLDKGTGLSRLHLVSGWPFWAQLLFFFVVHDLYIYWFHRWMHVNKYLWRLHEAHHSCEEVDWVAGSRSHPLEIMINQTIEFAPMVLLGAHPALPVTKATMDALWGMFIHSNVGARLGWLNYVINGPEMHRWHHATNYKPPGMNYGTKLALWDWLFGTAYLPREKPAAYGLPEVKFPTGPIGQTLFAFRRFDPPAPPAEATAPVEAVPAARAPESAAHQS